MNRAQLATFILANGFVRAQDRIGVTVYRDNGGGRRAKRELTLVNANGVDCAILYALKDRRRSVSQRWELS